MKRALVLFAAAVLANAGCASLSTQNRSGPPVAPALSESVPAPAFADLKSPIRARVLDRRFTTREAMYLASEMQLGSDGFLQRAAEAGLPVDDDEEFQYITAIESYWYSRYNMSALITEGRMGVDLVQSPYVTERALREGAAEVNRERGEFVVGNKTELVQRLIPIYLARTGYPRRFEDASPEMLEYRSGNPHLVRRLDRGIGFQSAENIRRDEELERLYGEDHTPAPAGMGEGTELWKFRVNYRENFLTLRWSEDSIDRAIDLGGVAQTLMKQVLWGQYFFRSHHHGGAYLGNNAEEGYRGAMITLMAVSKMLMLKSAMLSDDGRHLVGASPIGYDPSKRLLYFPHLYGTRGRFVGDLQPRLEELTIRDSTSELVDQGALLWALSEYYYFSDPTVPGSWNRVFGDNPPYDGSIMERKYIVLAQGLADMILKNMVVQHRDTSGVLASRWRPDSKTGQSTAVEDLAMAVLGLANYHRHVHVEPENQALALAMLRRQADFLVDTLQRPDGSFPDGYELGAKRATAGPSTLAAQAFGIRALLEAFERTHDERYLAGARRAYAFMTAHLWDDATGVFRSADGAEKTIYTPLNLGAALGAMRELLIVSPNPAELRRYKRFWVQAVDGSGIQQSEYEETGERDFSVCDGDHDGIPRMECGDGRYGVASVYASRVEIETPLSAVQTAALNPPSSSPRE